MYIAYPKALQALIRRIGATPEELAAWILLGPEHGGLAAYLNANELDPPPRFSYGHHAGEQDYIAPLMACGFKQDDIAGFTPSERFVSGKALIERWGHQPGIQLAPFIRAKVAESRLVDLHPTFGGTKGSFPESDDFPDLEAGLFPLSQIRAIEVEDGVAPHTLQPHETVGTDTTCNGKAPKHFADAMNELLNEIQRRSAAKDIAWNIEQMPGTKADLQAIACKFDSRLDGYALQTFDDYLVGICSFKRGRPSSSARNPYADLFPEFF